MPDRTMTDDEFLNYCEAHADTPRCGFVPQQLARLCRLAGTVNAPKFWEKQPQQVVDCDRSAIRRLVGTARAHLATQAEVEA